MAWIKKDSCTDISAVIERNVGMPAAEFLKESHTPIVNLDKTASRLREIAEANKTVTLFADYDCDGITSAAIMTVVFKALSIRAAVRFPRRSTGYGLQTGDVESFNSDVVITIDNGIAAHAAINAAKEKGVEVIVIDHHLAPEEGVPKADIIIDPHVFKTNEDDFDGWCAAGLAYELSMLICPEMQRFTLQFAAIGTVADVVPLVKDNRYIVQKGLQELNKTSIPALSILISEMCGASSTVSETDIGFKLAPAINAVGRIKDDAAFVYRTFFEKPERVKESVTKMIKINNKRKELVSQAVERAYGIYAEQCLAGDIPLIIYDPQTVEGIVGIVAGRLAEDLKIPVIVLTDSENDILKGSARSPLQEVNIKEVFDKTADKLLTYGGHAGAAGLSLKKDMLDDFKDSLQALFEDFEVEEKESDDIFYDLEIKAEDVTEAYRQLAPFAPFGKGNPMPIFKIGGFKLSPRMGSWFKILGDDEQTIKLFGCDCTAIGFGLADKYNDTGLAKTLDIIGQIGVNSFRGRSEVQIEMLDISKSRIVKNQSDLSKLLQDKLAKLKLKY